MRSSLRSKTSRVSPQCGFSLIELMVSMVIGLVLTLAIAAVMVSSENDKRSSTGVNDVAQSGSYAAYILDRQIRNAGSGFAQAWSTMVGCRMSAQNAKQVAAPRNFTSPPFVGWTTAGLPIALAPVVIGQGLADKTTGTLTDVRGDILLLMAGTGGFNEVPPSVLPGIQPTFMRLPNVQGFRANDLVLVADPSVPGNCIVEQVSGGAAQQLNFGGTYNKQVVNGVDVTTFGTSTTAIAAQIGNVNANLPQFSLIGVGDNSSLYSNELLPPDTATAADLDQGQQIADGVVEMRALYGTVPYPYTAGAAITWTDPKSSAGCSTTGSPACYGASALLAGTVAAQNALHSIVAIKLGLILRTSIGEQKRVYPVAASTVSACGTDHPGYVTLFKGLVNGTSCLEKSRVVSDAVSAGPYYRYRTVEVTIPLPNVVAAP